MAGINTDKWGEAHGTTVRESGSRSVRQMLLEYDTERGRAIDLVAQVLRWSQYAQRVYGIIARESLAVMGGSEREIEYAASSIAYMPCPGNSVLAQHLHGVFAWNEPDRIGGASAGLSKDEWYRRASIISRTFKLANPSIKVISPIMATGQTDYLEGVDLSIFDYIGMELYDMRVRKPSRRMWPDSTYGNGDAEFAIGHFHRFGKPIVVGEWGFTDPSRQPLGIKYTKLMFMRHPEVVEDFYFAYSDQMMPEPFGLFNRFGNPKPAWNAFKEWTV